MRCGLLADGCSSHVLPPAKASGLIYIKVGYELIYDCPQPTPMLLMLNIHYSHAYEIVKPDHLSPAPQ